jgi:hypothetical protein
VRVHFVEKVFDLIQDWPGRNHEQAEQQRVSPAQRVEEQFGNLGDGKGGDLSWRVCCRKLREIASERLADRHITQQVGPQGTQHREFLVVVQKSAAWIATGHKLRNHLIQHFKMECEIGHGWFSLIRISFVLDYPCSIRKR